MKKRKSECVYCGCRNTLILTIDHKIPKVRGGADEEKNMQVCCWICNQLKGALTHEEFKKYMKSLETLKELFKIKLIMQPLRLDFHPTYYPQFQLKEVKKDVNN